jgi:PadR family transcriptional regulator PadR
LENNGHVKSYIAKGDTGKERKYYRITGKGKKQLIEEKEKWKRFSISVNRVIGGDIRAFS